MWSHAGLHRSAWERVVGALAQLGERLVRNEKVEGSSPSGSTNYRIARDRKAGVV